MINSDVIVVDNKINLLVKWSTFLLLIGKGFLHFTSDQPYSYLFDNDIYGINTFGILLILTAFLCLLERKNWTAKPTNILLVISTIIIFLHSYGTFIKAGFVPEQLIEHCLQITLPLLYLIFYNSYLITQKSLFTLLGIIVGLTFIGHGMYALGVHYVPENFLLMTSNSLHFTNENSKIFLFVIGILDLVFSILLFIPKYSHFSIWYLIIWGLLTSLARIYYVLNLGITTEWLTINLPNTIYRLPHGLIPIAIYLLLSKMKDEKSTNHSFKTQLM